MGKKIADKLDKIVSSMRDELDKHDGSTLQAFFTNVKDGFNNIKSSLSQSKKANALLDDIKKLGEDLADAIKGGDQKLSAKLMDGLEKKVKDYKKEQGEEEKSAAKPKSATASKPKPAAKPKPKAAAKAKTKSES